MKKYLAILGAAVLMMALAAPAMAQFSSWGHMEIQTIWEQRPNFDTQNSTNGGWANNTTGAGTGGKDVNWRHVAERFRYYLQYGDPKTVRAVIGFEADSTDWGQGNPDAASLAGGGKMGRYTADTVQLEIKHAYLDFMIPNTPIEIIAGIQPWVYGGRLFINNDGAGVTAMAKFAPHTISAGWLRLSDTNRYSYNVTDMYLLDWKMVQKAFDVNVYGVYVNDRAEGQTGNTFTDIFSSTSFTVTNPFTQNTYYLGASAGFRPGNWTFFLHGLYVTGKREFDVGNDTDISAFAAEALARYQIGPGMAALVEGFYATGQDANKPDDQNFFPVARSSEARSIFGNDRTVFFWMNAAQMGYYHNNQIDFSGMWYGRAAFEYSPTAWVRMILNYLYIGDTSKGTPGTFTPKFASVGTARKPVNSPRGANQFKDEDYIGSEINLITTLNIYKNFVYNIGLYYFLPGAVFDAYNAAGVKTGDPKESYGINTKLVYAF